MKFTNVMHLVIYKLIFGLAQKYYNSGRSRYRSLEKKKIGNFFKSFTYQGKFISGYALI